MKSHYLDTILFLGIPVVILPLYHSRQTIDPGLLPRFMLLALFLFAIAFISIIRHAQKGSGDKVTLTISALHLCIVGYALFTLLSIIVAGNKSEALFETAKVLLVCTYFLTIIPIFSRSEKVQFILLRTVILLSLLLALLGILEYWNIFQLLDCKEVPAATMGNRNLLSSFLFLCSGFILFGLMRYTGLWYYLSLIACSAVIYVFIITQTRAVWVACFFSIACTGAVLFFILRNRTIISFRSLWPRVLVLLIIGSCLITFHSQFTPVNDEREPISERVVSVFDKEFESNQNRLNLWKKTVCMIRDNLFFGVGAGNWKTVLPKYNLTGLVSPLMIKIMVRPHNDFLWVFAETGVLGFLCFCGIFVFGFIYTFRMLAKRETGQNMLLAACLMYVITGYAVISFFDFPKERIAHQVLWGTVLALLISLNKPSLIQWNISKKIAAVLYCLVLILSVMCFFIATVRINSDKHMIRVLNFRKAGEWNRVVAETDSIHSFFYTMDHTSTPVSWYRGIANFSLNRFQDALRDFENANTHHPNHIHVLHNLGTCYEMNKNHSQAEKVYLKALNISPQFDKALVNLSAVYFNQGEYQKAYRMVLKCREGWDWRRETYIQKIEEKLNSN